MNKVLVALAFLSSTLGFSQSEVIGVPISEERPIRPNLKTGDTLNLPFSDDFSGPRGFPNTKRWTDGKAFVNNTFPINQPSRGVATFDGLNEGGRAYDLSSGASDTLADVLTSAYLNLQGVPSPFLNFMYQEGGFGEAPENADSLVVDFWNVDSTRWERVWSVEGEQMANDQWRWAAIPINHPKFLQKGFRFRIGNYGARNGGFDVWNIDYLSLESNRSPMDTMVADPALTRPLPNFMRTFTQVPWFHMNSAQYRQNMVMDYRRNGPAPAGGWSLYLGKYRMYQDNVEIDNRLSVPVVTNLDHDQNLSFNVPVNPNTIQPASGPTVVRMLTWFDGENVGIRKNDSSVFTLRYDNTYAFDDGTAERVYGLTQGNSYILNRFQPLQSDTLKGLEMYFGEAKVDPTSSPFKIVIFNFQNEAPSTIRYISDSIYYPEYAGGNNQFYTYKLDVPGIYINGTVYIGVLQMTSNPLTIGLDRNTDSLTQIVYGDGINWYPSLEKNSHLMMRPYFRYHSPNISVEESQLGEVSIYPNPSNGAIRVNWNSTEEARGQIFDLSGRMVWQGVVQSNDLIDLRGLKAGVYVFRMESAQTVHVEKFIIE